MVELLNLDGKRVIPKTNKSITLIVCILLLALPFSGCTFQQKDDNPKIESWKRLWGGTKNEWVNGVASDNSAIYVIGSTESNRVSGSDPFILKYDFDGNLLWNRTWSRERGEYLSDIAVDSSAVYITGITHIDPMRSSAFVIKYDFDGNLLWYRTWGNEIIIKGSVIEVDSSAIYIAGYLRGFVISQGSFLLKYDLNGNLLWNRSWNINGSVFPRAISVVNSEIYIAGFIYDHDFNETQWDNYICKYDINGNFFWNKTWGSPRNDYLETIIYNNSTLYIAGGSYMYNAYILNVNSDGILISNHTWNYGDLMFRFDINGTPILNNEYHGEKLYRKIGFAKDVSAMYIVETAWSSFPGHYDIHLLKFDINGNLLWECAIDFAGNDAPYAITFVKSALYIVGITDITVNKTTPNQKKHDVFILKVEIL